VHLYELVREEVTDFFFLSLPHQMHPTHSLDNKKFCSYCCLFESAGQHRKKKADTKIHMSPQFLPIII